MGRRGGALALAAFIDQAEHHLAQPQMGKCSDRGLRAGFDGCTQMSDAREMHIRACCVDRHAAFICGCTGKESF